MFIRERQIAAVLIVPEIVGNDTPRFGQAEVAACEFIANSVFVLSCAGVRSSSVPRRWSNKVEVSDAGRARGVQERSG